ncbi:golgin subfamily A member 7/ERF4 family domain-containing protein [Ditylenchus destructor]|nr:golgin subfamily A member 7/ERF4 family domain-containing protein [Ditylenchus destructor]
MVRPAAVSLDSCRKIFVERDYSQGLAVRFIKDFPSSLEGIVSRDDWEETIETINAEFTVAEQVCLASVAETVLGLFSCYISRLFFPTRYQKQLDKVRRYIDVQNKRIFLPVGLCLLDPMERGLRIIEINILSTGRVISSSPSPSSTTPMITQSITNNKIEVEQV